MGIETQAQVRQRSRGLALVASTFFAGMPNSYAWAAGAVFFGVAFLYRYLKFFRQYSYWLLLTYSEQPPKETSV